MTVLTALSLTNLAYTSVSFADDTIQPAAAPKTQTDTVIDDDNKITAIPNKTPDLVHLASGLIGMEIRNAEPNRLGKVEDIVFDYKSGKIAYIVMGRNNLLGMRQKQWAVPMSAFNPSEETRSLVLNSTVPQLEAAQGLQEGQWPAINNPTWGAQPFWNSTSSGTPPTIPPPQSINNPNLGPDADRANGRSLPTDNQNNNVNNNSANNSTLNNVNDKEINESAKNAGQPGKLNFIKNVCGLEVKDPSGAKLGSISDMVINWKAEKVAYTVFSPNPSDSLIGGKKRIAIPLNAYRVGADQNSFVLTSTPEKLAAAKGLGKDEWPSISNPDWSGDQVWEKPSLPAENMKNTKER